jgi:hypothetical protein
MIFLILNMKHLNSKIYRKYYLKKSNKKSNHCFSRKVLLMEDEDQNMHLKNLSIHAAQKEEEALNLLFLGDTNRMIAEVTYPPKTNNFGIFIFHF